jgi:hypothetical protein
MAGRAFRRRRGPGQRGTSASEPLKFFARSWPGGMLGDRTDFNGHSDLIPTVNLLIE